MSNILIPQSRQEKYLDYIARHLNSGNIEIKELSVTENGSYAAPLGEVYSRVDVSVPTIADKQFDDFISGDAQRVIVEADRIRGYAFYGYNTLRSIDIRSPGLEQIGFAAFASMSDLEELVVRKTSGVVQYLNTNGQFDPRASVKIYVPRALIEQYKTATNWVRLANQFYALEDRR